MVDADGDDSGLRVGTQPSDAAVESSASTHSVGRVEDHEVVGEASRRIAVNLKGGRV
jgi:hypothetical protein